MLTRSFFVTAPSKVSKKGAKKGMKDSKKGAKKGMKDSKKGAKKGMRKKSSKKEVKSPAPSASQINVPTETPVVTSAPSMPVVVPTASPVETAQPTIRPTPPAGSPTMVPTVTLAVTPAPTPVAVTDAPSPAVTSGAPTPAIETNVPTPAINTGTPTESPTISLPLGNPTSSPTAVPDDATSVPTPLVDPEATDAPTAAPVEGSGAPTPAIDTDAPTPAVVSGAPTPSTTGRPTTLPTTPPTAIETNVPTPAIDTGTPTEAPTISLPLGTDAPTAVPVEASSAPTPAIETGAPTPAIETGAPTPLIETNVPTPAIDTSVPTAAPFMIPTTGLPVDASPFSVTYEPIGEDPTEAQFDDAERITREYLEQFFVDFFEFSFEGEYVSLSVGVLDNTVGPPRIDYNLTAFFLPGAQTIPTEDEVDIVVQTAFSQPSVQTLILELRTLPLENPFSSTTTVSYSITEPMAAPLTTSSDSTGITVPAVLIGMAAGVGALACIVTAIFTARRRSQYRSIKQSLLPGMPYNSNIMAFMDRELATSRSFSSSQSSRTLPLHRNEI
jgi:hypothetical protein